MKKIFFALAALAALASCSKVEATYEQDVEINFNPVAANRTKAMLSGTTFPEENFNVWGYYKQVPQGRTIAQWMGSSLKQQNYIEEKPFTKKGTVWGGVTSYFWPKVGSLMFAGYYPTSAEAYVDYTFDSSVSKMTVTDYVAGDYQATGYVDNFSTSHTEDFMYFNMTPTSYNSTTQSNKGVEGNNVDVVFRHALSWINVVLVQDATAPNTDAAEITVHSVKFTSVLPQGDAVVDNTPGATTDEIVWTAKGTSVNVEVCPNDDATTLFVESDVVLSTTANHLGKQPLFIPQTMAGNLVVKYSIASTDGSKFTETKSINLSGLEGNGAWQPGKKYTYTITIGTSEILIDPSVDEWDAVPVSAPIV